MIINYLVNLYSVILFLVALSFIVHLRKRLKYDRQRYELFRIRDDLYKIAINNQIDQDAPEYRFTEELISSSIRAAENYDIFLLVKVLKDFDRMEEEIKKRQTLYDKIKSHKQLSRVFKDFTHATMDILRENSLFIKFFFALHRLGIFGLINKRNRLKEQPSVDLYHGFKDWNQKFA